MCCSDCTQVSNAQEELLQWHAQNAKGNPKIIHATERCAAGIIQAIGHFNLGPSISPRDARDFTECQLENVNPGHEIVKFYLFYERWRRGEVENSESYYASLKSVCVCYEFPRFLSLIFIFPWLLCYNGSCISLGFLYAFVTVSKCFFLAFVCASSRDYSLTLHCSSFPISLDSTSCWRIEFHFTFLTSCDLLVLK